MTASPPRARNSNGSITLANVASNCRSLVFFIATGAAAAGAAEIEIDRFGHDLAVGRDRDDSASNPRRAERRLCRPRRRARSTRYVFCGQVAVAQQDVAVEPDCQRLRRRHCRTPSAAEHGQGERQQQRVEPELAAVEDAGES